MSFQNPTRSLSKFIYEESLHPTNNNNNDIGNVDNVMIFNPYNPLNTKITEEEVKQLLTAYGLPPIVHNLALYQRAFVHRSYTRRPDCENVQYNIQLVDQPKDCLRLSTKSNETMEFIGDGILEGVTKCYLYMRFPKADEGFMTDKKIAIVKNEAIGRLAIEMGLNKWFIISRHAEEKGIRTNIKKLGCLFEAFVGAIFLDMNKLSVGEEYTQYELDGLGFQMSQKFIIQVFEKHIDWTNLIANDDNFKNILQVKIQKEFKVTPDYLIMQSDGERGYKMGLYLCVGQSIHDSRSTNALDVAQFKTLQEIHQYIQDHGSIFLQLSCGEHKIKRKAEQIACQRAIQLNLFC
jgi:dsRNA-specific ribonuclease